MNQMAPELKQSTALRMWRQGYSRNRIAQDVHVSYATIEKWLREAGLISDEGDIVRRLGSSTRGPHPVVRVTRDPCPRCGVRADLGCKHRPAEQPEMIA